MDTYVNLPYLKFRAFRYSEDLLMNRPARILIADDHQLLADACKALLEPEFMVVGTVRDGRHLTVAVAELTPDIVLLEVHLPRLNGLDAGEQIKKNNPKIKLVFLTTTPAVDVAAEAFRRGASGYVLKQSGATELLRAVRMVDQGNSYISPLIAKDTVTSLLYTKNTQREEKRITHRQTEILQLLAEGMSMKQVACEIDVKPATVAFHKYKMMETLKITSNAELLGYALKRQMIQCATLPSGNSRQIGAVEHGS